MVEDETEGPEGNRGTIEPQQVTRIGEDREAKGKGKKKENPCHARYTLRETVKIG